MFRCICLHDTKTNFRFCTNYSGMSSFPFSFRIKFPAPSGRKFHSGIMMSTENELRPRV